MDEIRSKAIALVLAGRYRILWDHIIKRGHEVSGFEIKMVLLHGRHAFDKSTVDRYQAFGYLNGKNLRVVYEFVRPASGELVLVITAFADEDDPNGREKGRVSGD